jgi:hypothetical protein
MPIGVNTFGWIFQNSETPCGSRGFAVLAAFKAEIHRFFLRKSFW